MPDYTGPVSLDKTRRGIEDIQKRVEGLFPTEAPTFPTLFGQDNYAPEGWEQTVQEVLMRASEAEQMPQRELLPNGLPADWDYRTADLGPWGEALPTEHGAKGWDPHGKPDFGPGLSGWLNYQAWRFTRESEPLDREQAKLNALPLLGETTAAWNEKRYGDYAAGVGKLVLYGISNIWQSLESSGGALQTITRYVSAAGSGLLEFFNLAAKGAEQAIGPNIMARDELLRRAAARGMDVETADAIAEWRSLPRALAIPAMSQVMTAQASRALKEGYVEKGELQEIRETYRQAELGRITYSAWLEPALREEFVRRVSAGEDPRLLAMELENPGHEMWGQIIFDPLNLVELAIKPVTQSLKATRAASVYAQVAYPRLLDDLAQMGTKGVDDVATTLRIMYGQANANMAADAASRTFWGLTAGGQRADYGQRMGNAISILLSHANGDPDTALDLITALGRLAQGDETKMAEALHLLEVGNLPANVAFSQAGNELALFMSDFVDNPRILDNMIAAADGDPTKLAELLGKHLDNALRSRFPTLTEQIAHIDEYADLAKTNPDGAAKFLERHPDAALEVSPLTRRANALHERLMQKFFHPVSEVQGIMYFGLNPAFRARNRLGNFTPTLVDMGPEVAIRGQFSPRKAREEVLHWLGGIEPPGVDLGFGLSGAGRDKKGIWNIGSRWAAADEASNSAQVYARSIRGTMGNALTPGRAIPPRTALPSLSDAEYTLLVRGIRDAGGNVDEALDFYRRAAQEGVSTPRNLLSIPDEDIKALRDLRSLDQVRDAARTGETLEDVEAALDALKRERRQIASAAGREMVMRTNVPAEVQEAFLAIEDNLGTQFADMAERRNFQATVARRSMREYSDEITEKAIRQIELEAQTDAIAGGDTLEQALNAARDRTNAMLRPFRSQVDGLGEATAIEARNLTRDALAWKQRIKTAPQTALRQLWFDRGLGTAPDAITRDMLMDASWQKYFYDVNQTWIGLREVETTVSRSQAHYFAGMAGMSPDTPLLARAEADLANSRMFDDAILRNRVMYADISPEKLRDAVARNYEAITDSAVNMGAEVTRWAHEGLTPKQALAQLDENMRAALNAVVGSDPDDQAKAMRVLMNPEGEGYRMTLTGAMDDLAPSEARFAHESTIAYDELIDRTKANIRENWGSIETARLDPQIERELIDFAGEAKQRVTEARAIAIGVADETRNFILHDYRRRRGFDLVLGYVFPYQYWYSRTYANWMKRLAYNPGTVAAYAKYRHYLESIHAGLPDWWKYNLNTNELLGLDSENPLYFNLELALNPLNGLTGVDFTDPKRRVDWWSSTVDDLNKFGPTVWTPYQLALAMVYHAQGKDEAASRWAGRLFMPTRAVRDITSLLSGGPGIEIDPNILFFSGGVGPYDRSRVGRAFSSMLAGGTWTESELIEAARTQEGPIWQEALTRSIRPRALGNLMPFIFGTGFKPRTPDDVAIDQYYAQKHALISQRDTLTDDEYRDRWSDLRNQYEFMDLLELSRKSGPERDEALAWHILSRIPPGRSDELAELVGMKDSDLNAFYENKGDLSAMNEAARLRLLGGIIEAGALLEVPERGTRIEWDSARALYGDMLSVGEQQFGEDVWDQVDNYYAMRRIDENAADEFLRVHPVIEQALNWKSQMIMNTPLLGAYYGSQGMIEQYFRGRMYDIAEDLFGDDLWEHFDLYWRLKDDDYHAAARAYWDDHPQLQSYIDFRDGELEVIEDRVSEVGAKIPEPTGIPEFLQEPTEVPPQYSEAQEAQYLAYINENPRTDEPAPDADEIVWNRANQLFPGTESAARQYYALRRSSASRAAAMLESNAELRRRVAWERTAVTQARLARQGQLTQAAEQQRSWQEWQMILGTHLTSLIADTARDHEIPDVAREQLEEIAAQLGMTVDQLVNSVLNSMQGY